MRAAPSHLDARLRFIWDLTVGQIAAGFTGIVLGFAWATWLSPMHGMAGAITGVYIGGIPVAAAFVASISEFDLGKLLWAIARWRRTEGRHPAGPGTSSRGYVLLADAGTRSDHLDGVVLDLDELWEAA